jgi:hypothetical protein
LSCPFKSLFSSSPFTLFHYFTELLFRFSVTTFFRHADDDWGLNTWTLKSGGATGVFFLARKKAGKRRAAFSFEEREREMEEGKKGEYYISWEKGLILSIYAIHPPFFFCLSSERAQRSGRSGPSGKSGIRLRVCLCTCMWFDGKKKPPTAPTISVFLFPYFHPFPFSSCGDGFSSFSFPLFHGMGLQ